MKRWFLIAGCFVLAAIIVVLLMVGGTEQAVQIMPRGSAKGTDGVMLQRFSVTNQSPHRLECELSVSKAVKLEDGTTATNTLFSQTETIPARSDTLVTFELPSPQWTLKVAYRSQPSALGSFVRKVGWHLGVCQQSAQPIVVSLELD